jgi:hypothetical protein
MTALTLTQTLQQSGPATALVLTDEQVEELAGGKRAAVIVRIGDKQARLRLAVMGGQNLIGMSKATRAELGVDFGDEVTATIMLDETPREVEVPAELAAAFASDPEAAAAYDKLAFTHRKEYARWVAEAKKEETRQRRAAEALQMLRDGRTRS